jgi:hypothetical protein
MTFLSYYLNNFGPFFCERSKRRSRSCRIGTFDLSDIFGHNITFHFTLRCRAGFFDFRFLPVKNQKSKKKSAITRSLKSYIIAQNFRKIECTNNLKINAKNFISITIGHNHLYKNIATNAPWYIYFVMLMFKNYF